MISSNAPTKFPVPFANAAAAGYIRAIPTPSQLAITPGAASLQDGFPPLNFTPVATGGIPPSGQDMNGILNQISAGIRWLQAGGLPSYDATFAAAIGGYPAGAILLNAAGTAFWHSTADNNSSNPDAGGAGWTAIGAPTTLSWGLVTGHPTTVAGYGITDALGSGQSWVDVTASRTPGVTYTNTTGKPIQLHIVTTPNGGLTLTVNGVTLANLAPSSSYIVTMAPIIPAGATYLVTSAAIGFWTELR